MDPASDRTYVAGLQEVAAVPARARHRDIRQRSIVRALGQCHLEVRVGHWFVELEGAGLTRGDVSICARAWAAPRSWVRRVL